MLNKAYEMSYQSGLVGSNALDEFMSYHDVKQIDCGEYFTYILKNDGSLWSCGRNNTGQLGLNDTTDRNTFTKVTTNINNDVKQIACGNQHIFILKNDGSVWACGANGNGQLGLGTSGTGTHVTTFTQVTTNINNDVKQIVCGSYDYTFILKNDGSVWACGYGGNGQLGTADIKNTFTKVTTNINNDVKQIACGQHHVFILKNDGSVWSTGLNEHGQLGLGNNTTKNRFTQVITNINNDVAQIACGNAHTFILKNDGSVWSCGYNGYGQLGFGTSGTGTHVTTFTQVTTNINNDVKQIVCGCHNTLILKNDGSLWSCGKNDYGELGLNDTTDRNTFTQVTTNTNNDVKRIACGYNYTFILKNDGSVWSCGINDYGQLGLGDTTDRTTFTQVTTNINNDVKQIACGQSYTFILKNDGSVYCCGNSANGQLGLGTSDTNAHSTFTQVTTNINNDVKQIACGHTHTFILKNDGSIWACGLNANGQLGLGDTTDRTTFTKTYKTIYPCITFE